MFKLLLLVGLHARLQRVSIGKIINTTNATYASKIINLRTCHLYPLISFLQKRTVKELYF